MSYSISVSAISKSELSDRIGVKLAEVQTAQPLHATDIPLHEAAAASLIALLPEDASRDCYCSMAGSIGTMDGNVMSLTLSVNVGLKERIGA